MATAQAVKQDGKLVAAVLVAGKDHQAEAVAGKEIKRRIQINKKR